MGRAVIRIVGLLCWLVAMTSVIYVIGAVIAYFIHGDVATGLRLLGASFLAFAAGAGALSAPLISGIALLLAWLLMPQVVETAPNFFMPGYALVLIGAVLHLGLHLVRAAVAAPRD
jgi:hypothetical protein